MRINYLMRCPGDSPKVHLLSCHGQLDDVALMQYCMNWSILLLWVWCGYALHAVTYSIHRLERVIWLCKWCKPTKGSRHANAAIMIDRLNAWCRYAARGKKMNSMFMLLERMATQKNHNERTLKWNTRFGACSSDSSRVVSELQTIQLKQK